MIQDRGALAAGFVFLGLAIAVWIAIALTLRSLSRDDTAPVGVRWAMIALASTFVATLPGLFAGLLIAYAFCECPDLVP